MAEEKSCAFRTSIGGQALIEGIMMRGPEKQAIVVRDPEGNLVEKVEDLKFVKDRYPILGWPLVRGTVNFLASMVNGVKALMYSAEFYPDEEVSQPSRFEQWLEKKLSSKKMNLWSSRWLWCWAWVSAYSCLWCCPPSSPAACCTSSPMRPCGCVICWRVR